MANKTTQLFQNGKTALIALTFLGAASSCFGTVASCAASTDTSKVRVDQIAGVAIASAGPGNDFGSLNTAGGCSTSDLVFTNLIVTGGVVASGSYFSTLTNQSFTTGAEDVILSSVRGADTNPGSDGTNDYFGNAPGGSLTIGSSYLVTSTSPISTFSLNLLGGHVGNVGGGSITGSVELCLGGQFTGITCSAGAGSIETITLISGTFAYNNIVLTNGVTTGFSTIGVLNNFTLVGGSLVDTFVTSFDETFDTPEPSTFALFLSALTGLAALRLRRRS